MTATLSPNYSDEEIALAIATLAKNGGALRPTARALKDQGIEVSAPTLQEWRDDRHRSLYDRALVDIEKDMAQKTEAAYDRLLGLEQQTMDRYARNIDDLKPRELSQSIRDLAVASGVHNQNARLLRDRPTAVVEHRAPHELYSKLSRMAGIDVDSTADELDPEPADAELAPEPQGLTATGAATREHTS